MITVIRIVLALTGLILLIDGSYLLFQGKYHLGIFIPFIVGLIFCAHAFFWSNIKAYLNRSPRLKQLWKICWIGFFIWLFSLILFFTYIQINTNKNSDHNEMQAIIVLGSGLIQGKASPTLQSRLDKAADVHKTVPNAIIIVTGGYGLGQQKSEAEVMAHYLNVNHHIKESQILLENQSTSTELNLKNSQPLLEEKNIHLTDSIAIVSSDFHTPRAAAIARKQGYTNITTYNAETPIETRYNAWLREYFAYISGWVLGEYDLL